MRQIRRGVFETNSSSTHSLTMCSQEEFNKWKSGEFVFDTYTDKFAGAKPEITDEDKYIAKNYYENSMQKYWKPWDELSEEEKNEWYDKYMDDHGKIDRYRYKTYNQYFYDSYLETFTERYTSPSGDNIVAFGQFGYDG